MATQTIFRQPTECTSAEWTEQCRKDWQEEVVCYFLYESSDKNAQWNRFRWDEKQAVIATLGITTVLTMLSEEACK